MELNSSNDMCGMFQNTSFCSSQSTFSLKQVVLYEIVPRMRKDFEVNFAKLRYLTPTLSLQVELCSQPLTRQLVCSDDLRQQ